MLYFSPKRANESRVLVARGGGRRLTADDFGGLGWGNDPKTVKGPT